MYIVKFFSRLLDKHCNKKFYDEKEAYSFALWTNGEVQKIC